MYKTRNAMLGILTLTSVSGVVLAVPTQAAERHIAGVHKAVPERWLTYPYGGLISQEGETLGRLSRHHSLLRQLLRPRGLLQLLGLLRSSLL
jgi:hypothetical protein